MKPCDGSIYTGDNSKLRGLRWRPRITMEKALSDMLEYWRGKLR
jgi:nucleoside-diphosphate-sugar epimerase